MKTLNKCFHIVNKSEFGTLNKCLYFVNQSEFGTLVCKDHHCQAASGIFADQTTCQQGVGPLNIVNILGHGTVAPSMFH